MLIVIDGDPISRRAPKFFRRGSFVGTYDSQALLMREARNKVQDAILDVAQADIVYGYSVFSIVIRFYLKPKGLGINRKLWGFMPCCLKRDVDNLTKALLDIGNGILWPDDSQIVSIQTSKQYDANPRTEIEIMASNEISLSDKTQEILSVFSPRQYQEFNIDILALAAHKSLAPGDSKICFESATQSLVNFAMKYSDQLKKIKKIAEK